MFLSTFGGFRTRSLFPSTGRSSCLSALVGGTSNLDNPLCLPRRLMRTREVKQFYDQDGTHDPPVQAVLDRFKRLRWGAYIHPRAGRARHLYRRSERAREQLKEHILTNRATSFLLDNMVNRYWRRPKYYPEDIYEPYHTRTGVPWGYGQRKPKFFP